METNEQYFKCHLCNDYTVSKIPILRKHFVQCHFLERSHQPTEDEMVSHQLCGCGAEFSNFVLYEEHKKSCGGQHQPQASDCDETTYETMELKSDEFEIYIATSDSADFSKQDDITRLERAIFEPMLALEVSEIAESSGNNEKKSVDNGISPTSNSPSFLNEDLSSIEAKNTEQLTEMTSDSVDSCVKITAKKKLKRKASVRASQAIEKLDFDNAPKITAKDSSDATIFTESTDHSSDHKKIRLPRIQRKPSDQTEKEKRKKTKKVARIQRLCSGSSDLSSGASSYSTSKARRKARRLREFEKEADAVEDVVHESQESEELFSPFGEGGKYICDFCGWKLSTPTSLALHESMHIGSDGVHTVTFRTSKKPKRQTFTPLPNPPHGKVMGTMMTCCVGSCTYRTCSVTLIRHHMSQHQGHEAKVKMPRPPTEKGEPVVSLCDAECDLSQKLGIVKVKDYSQPLHKVNYKEAETVSSSSSACTDQPTTSHMSRRDWVKAVLTSKNRDDSQQRVKLVKSIGERKKDKSVGEKGRNRKKLYRKSSSDSEAYASKSRRKKVETLSDDEDEELEPVESSNMSGRQLVDFIRQFKVCISKTEAKIKRMNDMLLVIKGDTILVERSLNTLMEQLGVIAQNV